MRLAARVRGDVRLQSTLARYAFAVAAVAAVFVLRTAMMPMAGRMAPFVMLFTAMLATSLYAGVGPAILALVLSLTLSVAAFGVPAGHPSLLRAFFQPF